MVRWNREFEFPDIIAYEDFEHSAGELAAELATGLDRYEPARLASFPYPNPPKLRDLSLPEFRDSLLLRVGVAAIAARSESLYSPSVRQCRLEPQRDEPWRFRKYGRAHADFRKDALKHLEKTSDAMCRTDITRYYGSIDIELLVRELLRQGHSAKPIAFIQRVLGVWHGHGIRGLPIGPEACGVLGNSFLIPVDRVLAPWFHLRWMDDLLIFGATTAACAEALPSLDTVLADLGLVRSLPKTHVLENADAVRDVRSGSLSLGYLSGTKREKEWLRRVFDRDLRECDNPDPGLLRRVLGAMGSCQERYAAIPLSERASLMNLAPREAGTYLAKAGRGTPKVTENLMLKLEQVPDDATDALDFHLLRALRGSSHLGRSEGRTLNAIMNGNRRPIVREAAWQVFRETPLWTERTALEAISSESHPGVRRAIVATFKSKATDNTLRSLKSLETKFPEIRFTRVWLAAA